MPLTEAEPDHEGAREFRALLTRLQWTPQAFARAAKIKTRSAVTMHEGRQGVPPRLMDWLREMVRVADAIPPPPVVSYGDGE